ncbi:VIER F-box protein 3 [Artemisia annua]|uniref:VIER F-box protein 3 n=1 Tax=Artemisia annua TaxID=35608 RepID=A0A2U1L683_ARTAN|nr:VIER F-box protein 3 [Artemisia annua]
MAQRRSGAAAMCVGLFSGHFFIFVVERKRFSGGGGWNSLMDTQVTCINFWVAFDPRDSTEVESQDAASEGVQDGAIETPTVTNHIEGASNSASRSTSRSTSFKARLGLIAGRSLVCTFRKWSSFGGSSSRSQ